MSHPFRGTARMEQENIEAEDQEFDLDRALNTKGFLEFLGKHPDAESFDMENAEAVQEKFETFESIPELSSQLKEVYSQKIETDLGIKLDKTDLAALDAHLEDLAVTNPEQLEELGQQLNNFVGFPADINALVGEFREQLGEYGSRDEMAERLEMLKGDKKNLDNVKDVVGFGGKAKFVFRYFANKFDSVVLGKDASEEYKNSIKEDREDIAAVGESLHAMEEKFGNLNKKGVVGILEETEAEIAQLEAALGAIDEVVAAEKFAREQYFEAREKLLGGISDVAGITAAVQAKVDKQFEAMMKKGGMASFEKLQERLSELQDSAEGSETGLDPFSKNPEELQAFIDERLEGEATAMIEKALKGASLGNNALTKLEKALEPLLEKESLGSKDEEETKEFIRTTLEEVADGLGDKPEDKAKKIMIARILAKTK
jgi:hypothetical protein